MSVLNWEIPTKVAEVVDHKFMIFGKGIFKHYFQ